jgi:hypothetical protein
LFSLAVDGVERAGGCDGHVTGRGVVSACWSGRGVHAACAWTQMQCMCMNELVRLGREDSWDVLCCREGG